jgi:hypothetical protein
MNNVVFSTGGSWETTTLFNNNQEVMAVQLFVELQAGRDEWDDPVNGGIATGGELTALVRPQENPQAEWAIFPGRLEMNFPAHSVIVENTHPGFAFEYTRVWFDGRDVTNSVMDIYVDINAADNIVEGRITLYKDRWFGTDEVATFTLV